MKTLNPTEDPPDDLPEHDGERVGWSCHIISSVRELKFNEMEYAVPAEEGPVCFRAVRDRIREKHPNVVWPVEYRTLAPDDAPLSPAYERPTVTISVHQDARLPFRGFFADVEAVFAEHRGRPHWGKIHTRTRQELSDLYPEWETFCAQRARTDPAGRFLNEHLRGLFAGT
jgi:FAD/FMN-containing dehydrogenase